MNRTLIVASSLAFSVACSSEPTTAELSVAGQDSAGVVVVNIESLEHFPVRTLSAPVLEIPFSGPTAEASFTRLGAAVRLPDGRVVIADGGTRTLKLFEADGSFSRQLSAPGEVIMARSLWVTGEGLIVGYDRLQKRVSSHSLEGGAGSFWVVDSARVNSRSIGRLDSGEILLRTLVFEAPATGFDTTVVAITANREGVSVPDSVGQWKSARMGRVGEPPTQLVTSPIFEPTLAAAAAFDRLVVSDCRVPEMQMLHPTEGLRQIVRWPSPVESVTEEDVRVYRLSRLEGLDREDQLQVRRMLDAKTVSLRLPVCDELRIDAAGRTWVRQFARPADTLRHWLVFDADGRPLFSLDTPVSSRVVYIGDDHLVILEIDSPDGNRIRVYALD